MDVISSLPGNIIDSILARLPLQEAVRTSILSREWRYNWTSIPNIVFDFIPEDVGIDQHKKAIYRVLLNHQGPLNKFSLNWTSSRDIGLWFLLLPSFQVHDFTLCIWGAQYPLDSLFFSFQNLKHLCLSGCIFKPPPKFKGFPKLVTLNFKHVLYVPAIFEQFISQSPLLEWMRLCTCTKLDAFELQGPSLRFFSFCGDFNSICFKKSPVLAEILLILPTRSTASFKCFHFPPMLKTLNLYPCMLEFTDAGGVPIRFPVADSLNNLKVLNLSMYMEGIEEVAHVFCLLRSSPNLEILRITSYTNRDVQTIKEFIRAQENTKPYLHQLRRVEFKFLLVCETEMELLRYLLADSDEGLVEVVITTISNTLSDDVMNRLKQFIEHLQLRGLSVRF